MMTTLTTEQSAVALPPVPLADEEAYQQSVKDGIFSLELCEATFRCQQEWDWDRRRYLQDRFAPAQVLADLPKLEQAALAAEELAKQPPLQLTGKLTIDEIWEVIAEIDPRLRTDSWEGLAAGCRLIPQQVQLRQAAAQRARDRVRFARQDAELRLLQSAGVPPRQREVQVFTNLVKQVEQRIAARRPALEAERQIPSLRKRIEQLVTGEISIRDQAEWQAAGFNRAPSEWQQVTRENRTLLQRAKVGLAGLIQATRAKSELETENQEDVARLRELKQQLEEIQNEQRAWQLDPRNMKFAT